MTEELKKAIESAKTDDEKKSVANKFKDELLSLSEEELAKIAGGHKELFTSVRCAKCGFEVKAYLMDEYVEHDGIYITHIGCGGRIEPIFD